MDSTLTVQSEQVTLTTLADRINTEHHAAEQALNAGLQHALRAGQLLTEAKGLCDHGAWLPWLEEHFEGSARTARAYMLVAQRWPQLESNRQCHQVRPTIWGSQPATGELPWPVETGAERMKRVIREAHEKHGRN